MPDNPSAPAETGRWEYLIRVGIVAALVVGIVGRFVTRSPLWLDEALSVNIASMDLGDIGSALRNDGHPPLYYYLLHGWMKVFGEGDTAVRALSGVTALALLPLLWVAGRRLAGIRGAWYAIGVAALSPYLLRYGTETRMYAMLMVAALAGWLLVDDSLHRPSKARLAGVAAVVAVMLWTHYWSLWLLATLAIALIVRVVVARRRHNPQRARRALMVLGAMAVGGLAFVPWLPTLAYQGAHTGTPWARPVRPTEMLTFTLADLGGGPHAEALLLGWFLALLALTGLMARSLSVTTLEIDLRTRPEGRALAVAIVGTLSIACVVGYATGATYASRYAAVFVPFLILLVALGLTRLAPQMVAIAFAVIVGLGLLGGYRNITVDRSDAARSAEAIEAAGVKGDLVVFCPDQLGPSTTRLLGDGFDEVTYPAFAAPDVVDWVDYTDRLDAASPEEFATEALERAGERSIFLVYSTSYITHEETCPALFNALGAQRSVEVLTSTTEAFEPSGVARFAPPGP